MWCAARNFDDLYHTKRVTALILFYIIVTQNVCGAGPFPSNIVCWSLEKENHLTMHKCRARWQSDTKSVVCITKQVSC